MFNFKKENQDYRSLFANEVCKLLMQNSNNDIDIAVNNVESIYNHFEENVRNIYELIDNEIPLFALYRLNKYGADNYGFDEQEYQNVLENTKKACVEFYID